MAVGFENSNSFSEVKCLQGCSKNSLFSFLVLLKDMRTFGVTQGYEDISCCCFFGVTQGYEDISCWFFFSVNQEN